MTYGDVVKEYTDKLPDGYMFEKDTAPLTIDDSDRELTLWNDSDGLQYKDDGNTYFQINSNGEVIILDNNGDELKLQNLLPGDSASIDFELDRVGKIDAVILKTGFETVEKLNVVEGDYIEFGSNEYDSSAILQIKISTNVITHDYIFVELKKGNSVIKSADFDVNKDIGSILCNIIIEDISNIDTIKVSSHSYCYTADTLITLADGSTKQVKDITYDDELKVWNFDEGKDDVAKPLWIKRTEHAKSYQLVTLSDGNTIKLCGSDGKYHCMFDITEQKFNHAVDCVGHEVYTENGIATVVSIEEVKEKVDHYNIVTNYHMNLYANHILTSTEKNNIYPIEDMKFVKDDRKIVPYEEFEKAHISREYYDGWRAGEWNEPLKDVITHLRRRKMYAKPQKRVKDGLRTDYFG